MDMNHFPFTTTNSSAKSTNSQLKKASFLQKIDEIVENCGVLVSEYHVKAGLLVAEKWGFVTRDK